MTQLSSSSSHDRLQVFDSDVVQTLGEFGDELEREKIELPQAVKDYIAEHVRILEEKMSKGEGVTEEDMAFIEEVKLMIEAHKRHITVQQWLDLLHVAKSSRQQKEWIDTFFTFPGNKQIEAEYFQVLNNKTFSRVPENLHVKGVINLNGCTSIQKFPETLKVDDSWFLAFCKSLIHLPGSLSRAKGLYLYGCELLTHLPEPLEVEENLNIVGCISLTHLPENLRIGGTIDLSSNLYPNVIKDAEKLVKEGKIGRIKFYE